MLYSKTYTAEGAIPKFRFVKFGAAASSVLQATAVTDRIIGVYIGTTDAVAGDSVEVCLLGECMVTAGGSIGRGMTLTTDATGQAVNAAPAAGANAKTAALALDSAASGTQVPVLVVPGWYQG